MNKRNGDFLASKITISNFQKNIPLSKISLTPYIYIANYIAKKLRVIAIFGSLSSAERSGIPFIIKAALPKYIDKATVHTFIQ